MGSLKFQNFYFEVLQLDIIIENRYANVRKTENMPNLAMSCWTISP